MIQAYFPPRDLLGGAEIVRPLISDIPCTAYRDSLLAPELTDPEYGVTCIQ